MPYLLGAFPVFTGIKVRLIADHMPDMAIHPLLKLVTRQVRVTHGLRGISLWVRESDATTGKVGRDTRSSWWA